MGKRSRACVTLGRGKTATKKLAEDAIKLIKNVASKKKSFSFSFLSTEKKKTFEAHTFLLRTSLYSAFLPPYTKLRIR